MEPEEDEPAANQEKKQRPDKSKEANQPKEVDEQAIRKMTDEELLNYVYYIDIKNRQLKSRIALLEPYKERQIKEPPIQKQNTLFDKFKCKKYALKIAYIGINYNGMAVQESTDNTIEGYLFKCLYGISLIKESAPTNQYRRAGRTDKGVSSFGNVVSLFLRTSQEKAPSEKPLTMKDKRNGDLNYAKMLNSLLPNDIRVLAYREVPEDFDARRDCYERQYKYFFASDHLNLSAMHCGIKKFVGKHNFLNFCKLDVTTTIDFVKTISEASIKEFNYSLLGINSQNRNKVYYFHFIGNSFLWHQIRYMAAILFLIGSGKESPDLIDQLLDHERCKNKPNYSAAPQFPLILEDCRYKNVIFDVHPEDACSFYNTFNDIVLKKTIELTLYVNCMVLMKDWLFESTKMSERDFLEKASDLEAAETQRKMRKKKMLKASGLNLQDCVANLKGKNKQMYQRVYDKRSKFDRLKQIEDEAQKQQNIQKKEQ